MLLNFNIAKLFVSNSRLGGISNDLFTSDFKIFYTYIARLLTRNANDCFLVLLKTEKGHIQTDFRPGIFVHQVYSQMGFR